MKRKICPHCKTHNPEEAIFCKRCGALFTGEPEYKDDNNFFLKHKNIIAVAACAVLLVIAFAVFKSGSPPKTVATTVAPTESSTLPTTLPPTTAPSAVQTSATETTTQALTLPTLPSTTAPTTAAPTTTAAPSADEIEEICDEYNTLIYNLKYSGYEPSIHKTIETGLEINSFSLPVNTDTLNRFMKNLLPKTSETYTFSADGVATENSAVTLDNYIPPVQGAEASVYADAVKSATRSSEGTITIYFKPDSSSYSDGKTDIPPYVSTATEYLDFATFALGPVGITKAEIEYPETVITAEVDSDGDIIKLSIKQPVSVNCTGGVGSLTADVNMTVDTLTVYEVTY